MIDLSWCRKTIKKISAVLRRSFGGQGKMESSPEACIMPSKHYLGWQRARKKPLVAVCPATPRALCEHIRSTYSLLQGLTIPGCLFCAYPYFNFFCTPPTHEPDAPAIVSSGTEFVQDLLQSPLRVFALVSVFRLQIISVHNKHSGRVCGESAYPAVSAKSVFAGVKEQ